MNKVNIDLIDVQSFLCNIYTNAIQIRYTLILYYLCHVICFWNFLALRYAPSPVLNHAYYPLPTIPGNKGDRGANGSNGNNGEAGATGSSGNTGSAGSTGSSGSSGQKGIQGANGSTVSKAKCYDK